MNALFRQVIRNGISRIRSLAAMAVGLFAFNLAAQAGVTSLTMTSDPGDYIGQGQTYVYTAVDGQFGAQRNYANGVSISFNTQNYSHWWYLDFAAPDGVPLAVGTYTGAVRFPFQGPGQPGLSVYGDGRGCNTLTGSFQVVEVSYDAWGQVQVFDATFEQHCEGSTAALRGEIRYNATTAVNLVAPSNLTAPEFQLLTFTVSATDVQSRHVVLSASGLPAGATFVDNGDNTGTFSWTPSGSQAGSYTLSFQGSNLQGDTAVTYTKIQVIAPPPVNDDISHATPVTSIPFSVSEDVSNATTGTVDPYTCYWPYQSVWFSYTPQSNARIEVNTYGSSYDTTLTVFSGAPGTLSQIGCNDDSNGTLSSRVRFDAVAGTTYYFRVSSLYPVSSASLVLNVQLAPPPFSFAPTINQFATVTPTTGAVAVSGSVSCTQPALVFIYGQLKQVRGGVPINGWYQTMVPCDGTTAWQAAVQATTTLFRGRSAALFSGGPASISAFTWAMDPDSWEVKSVNLQENITLRGK